MIAAKFDKGPLATMAARVQQPRIRATLAGISGAHEHRAVQTRGTSEFLWLDLCRAVRGD
jgi:hypothetical protein